MADPRQSYFPTGATVRRSPTVRTTPLLTFPGLPRTASTSRTQLSFGKAAPAGRVIGDLLGFNMGKPVVTTARAPVTTDPRRSYFPTGATRSSPQKTATPVNGQDLLTTAAQNLFQRMGLGSNPDRTDVAATPAAFWSAQPQKSGLDLPPVAILGALGVALWLIMRKG